MNVLPMHHVLAKPAEAKKKGIDPSGSGDTDGH